ncbi:hypothetical protein FBZ33_6536 [Micromonospora sp. A202]|uniref:hypothetical protein n=1 Tax=Micromonospora sp. A202 TaxID=2572899 RepID=UPI0011500C63|nr:hypothetical protein [Micromonospora sp. A202]TQJ26150.1 hypothetical protein FBZ33_6536 [Micromonospora sp. A202]
MAIVPIDPAQGPLSTGSYLVMSFDQRNAQLAVFGDHSYMEGNVSEAIEEAKHGAEQAAALGLPLQFLVVRVSTEHGFKPAAGAGQ